MISVTTAAGAAATASRPPLIADRCLRTQLISAIGAPLRSSAAPTRRSSSAPTPSAGSASSDDPPPEMRHRTRSSAVSPPTCVTIRAAATRPASSGTGWAASTTSTRAQATLWPYGVTTRPDRGPRQACSTARAMAAAAFPAPTTTVRPAGGSGSRPAITVSAEAAATAASNRESRQALAESFEPTSSAERSAVARHRPRGGARRLGAGQAQLGGIDDAGRRAAAGRTTESPSRRRATPANHSARRRRWPRRAWPWRAASSRSPSRDAGRRRCCRRRRARA